MLWDILQSKLAQSSQTRYVIGTIQAHFWQNHTLYYKVGLAVQVQV